MSAGSGSLEFACPGCASPLTQPAPDERRCPQDGAVYRRVNGVWHFIRPDRAAFFAQFIREYETVRAAEGRGSDDPAYYRALPFVDLTGRFASDWQIRAQSFSALIRHVIAPLEARHTPQAGGPKPPAPRRAQLEAERPQAGSAMPPAPRRAQLEAERPLQILDLGAGNGWLSYQLSKRGHCAAAIDLLLNERDGLGAHARYDVPFTPIQAEFEHLPLAGGQSDIAIFNSSFHYAVSYEATLAEALRVLKAQGTVVILDTPIYAQAASGAQMVAERQAQFAQRYGFPSNALASENYLTYDRLATLGRRLGIAWQTIRPARGWRWRIRPWAAMARGRREPAEFLLITGRRKTC